MALQDPHHEGDSPSGVLDDLSTATPLAIPPDKPSGPTLGTRLIIFSALVLPSALIPLLVLRRSVNGLHRKVDELREATRGLHYEFKSVISELVIRREQHEQLRAMIAETKEGLAQLRREAQRVQMDRTSEEERLRKQMQDLATSNQCVKILI
jgi:septal ring factor EnvC (AmiA/AmiB activator)